MNITQTAKQFGLTARALRYYEQIGLLESQRIPGYAYRSYDEAALLRLRQILLLRRLRLPLRQIQEVLQKRDPILLTEILRANRAELSREIAGLAETRALLEQLLKQSELCPERLSQFLEAGSELPAVCAPDSKEEFTMEKPVQSGDPFRVITLPPMTVASARCLGESPEDPAGELLKAFVRQTDLIRIKPDLRVLGFNNPSPQREGEPYGYEFWVSIPPDLEVAAPMEKKYFPGGLYAAHWIRMGDFQEWGPFFQAVQSSEDYVLEDREPSGMGGALEEHLNPSVCLAGEPFRDLDLLIPIRRK